MRGCWPDYEAMFPYGTTGGTVGPVICRGDTMTRTLELGEKWAPVLIGQPETGMGYQITTVILKDGSRFPNVTIAGGIITEVAGHRDIPIKEEDIADILVTHGK